LNKINSKKSLNLFYFNFKILSFIINVYWPMKIKYRKKCIFASLFLNWFAAKARFGARPNWFNILEINIENVDVESSKKSWAKMSDIMSDIFVRHHVWHDDMSETCHHVVFKNVYKSLSLLVTAGVNYILFLLNKNSIYYLAYNKYLRSQNLSTSY